MSNADAADDAPARERAGEGERGSDSVRPRPRSDVAGILDAFARAHGQKRHASPFDNLRELEEYCTWWRNDSLSPEGLCEKLRRAASTSQSALACSNFMHELCRHPKVTCTMVEEVLRSIPYAAYFCTNEYHGRTVDPDEIKDIEDGDSDGSESHSGGEDSGGRRMMSDRCYPIHVACANERCPGSVVRLLAKSNPSALGHFCLVDGGCRRHQISTLPFAMQESTGGLPIHYYMARPTNMDLETAQCLVEAYPSCLSEEGCLTEWHPVHILAENEAVGENMDILRFLVGKNAGFLELENPEEEMPIHSVFRKGVASPELVKFLIEAGPVTALEPDRVDPPIHMLCSSGREIDFEVLKILIEASPFPLRWHDPIRGMLPIHSAASHCSPDVIKALIDARPESVKARDRKHRLPFHYACESAPVDTVKCLYEAYPECISAGDLHGLGPVHLAALHKHDPLGVINFLLHLDPEGASRVARPYIYENPLRFHQYNLFLPLHYAAENGFSGKGSMDAIRHLFNVYPDALLLKTNATRPVGPTALNAEPTYSNFCFAPEGIARETGHTDAVQFLAQQSEDLATSRDAPQPLHHAIKEDLTLGTVKLLAVKFQDQISVSDEENNSLLHQACKKGRVDIVLFLLDQQPLPGIGPNNEGKAPIELLLEQSVCQNKESTEFIEAFWHLLVANPGIIGKR